jgi:uncharacterized repeat protein (TIGR03803 family)
VGRLRKAPLLRSVAQPWESLARICLICRMVRSKSAATPTPFTDSGLLSYSSRIRLSRNFRFSSQQPDTIYPFRDSTASLFSLAGPRARGPDGHGPNDHLIFDATGNMYGTTASGGAFGYGTVFKLTHSGGRWTESVLYNFMAGQDGSQPVDGVVMDGVGNLYGTTRFGGVNNCSSGCGTVFELSPSGSGWTEHVLYRFPGGSDGYQPYGGVVLDPAGNLFGATFDGGHGGSGVVFELSPSGGTWNYSVLYNLTGNGGGEWARLTRDAAGNLSGITLFPGTLFKLSPSGGQWLYTDLHDFTLNEGSYARSGVVLDSQDRIYGMSSMGGADQQGTAWEFTP